MELKKLNMNKAYTLNSDENSWKRANTYLAEHWEVGSDSGSVVESLKAAWSYPRNQAVWSGPLETG